MLTELINKYNEEKNKFTENIKTEFTNLVKSLKFPPQIQSIGWTQYTPYFNDGDECTFSVNSNYLYISGDDNTNFIREKIYNYKTKSFDKNPDYNKDVEDFYKNIKNILESMPPELMKDIFGDHVEVTINNDGNITTKDFEHE